MVDPLLTTAAVSGLKLAVEACKGRKETTIEKLSQSDRQDLHKLVIWSELAVIELESMNRDFLDSILRHPSMTATAMFHSWSALVSDTALSVKTFIEDHRNGKKQPRVLPEFLNKGNEKKIKKLLEYKISIDRLLDSGHRFNQNADSFLVPQLPEQVIKIENVPELEGFPSLKDPLEQALKLLKSSKPRSIGILGSFGVGKTSVLRNLNNCQEVAELFDMVIFLDGSAVESDKNLLQAIARRVKMPQDVQVTAESVSLALRKYNKCLLLCDDVKIELSALSLVARSEVSYHSGHLDFPPGSKVVLTARLEFTRICHPIVEEIVDMPSSLTPKEAWKMFQKVVGKEVIEKPGIEEEARRVSNLCCCIPFVIRTVATNFIRMDNAAIWRRQLGKLEKERRHEMEGLEEIYNYWKSCYDQLKNNMANCFLYAALHPAGRKIRTQHLIESWTEEGLIDSNADSMTRRDMLDEGQVVLKELTDFAFLEKCGMMFVEMNSSVHEFAMHVQSKGDDRGRVIVKTRATESPTLEDWRMASRISMVDNSVCELPESTGCENLLTLLLQKNSNLTTIPSSFFQHMNKLVLLDLYKTGIAELPSSVSNLVVLKALYLNDCNQLMVLPAEIKKLESLEVLDIRDTKLYYLPEDIWSLVKLKCLRTSYTGTSPNQKEVKDHNVMSGLPLLEELVIYVKSYQHWCEEVKHIIRLVAGMTSLINLRFCFPDAETLKTFLAAGPDVFGRLRSFHLYVGHGNKYCPEILDRLEHDNIVQYLRYCDGENDGTDTIKCILARSQALELVGHKDIIRLSDLGRKSFKSIYDCVIESCDRMVTVSEGNMDIGDMLPRLQKLYLRNLKSLKCVAEAEMLSKYWGLKVRELMGCSKWVAEAEMITKLWGLKVLELKGCPKLTRIVSQGVLEKLSELKTLVVENCGKIEVLILQPRGKYLPALQTLRLLNLQKLQSICADESIFWPSLEVLEINGCPKLNKLPITKNRAPKLSVYEGEQLQKWMRTQ